MPEPALLSARDLTVTVAGRDLVRDVSLDVAAGSLQVIVGPNGAGKSTLLRLLCGELRPTHGQVAYEGEAVGTIPAWRLAAMRAVLPQAARLAFPFAAAEVARIGLDGIGRGLGARDRDAILARALDRADIAHLASRAYPTLSGGEQARVQFARVLCQMEAGRTVANRQVLFLDEPTASLDLRHQGALLDAAAALAASGTAVVAILHDLNLAAAYADTLLVLEGGRLVASGRPVDVLRDELIGRVFGVRWPVGKIPGPDQPFILPHRT
ncbi:heme ABC transporter ATP-binding protein [Methylobacterium sp. E-066]|uniref:heme ABC transporter ATP-binding protein n=1 Tax=Methylobacterium sp. E-066 TaxID=2836584 RepID=UPI001FB9D2C0|nr:heme ABC transporter ATP-binding protein [Methylobacterium sp. E-066]MCJ2139795.1 heme ABC transporter ATP-binding protein [Methylobacterium sp. E-066]